MFKTIDGRVFLFFIVIFIGILIIFLLATALCFLNSRSSWRNAQKPTSPKYTFAQFRNLYAIAPDNWRYKLPGTMELELDEKFIPLFYLERDDDGELRKKIRVQFSSYSEYRKFENFVYSEKSRQDALKKLRLEGDLINSLQKDIDEYRKKTNVELKAMKEKIEAEQERVLKKLQEQSQL